jgi:hypothetical protein
VGSQVRISKGCLLRERLESFLNDAVALETIHRHLFPVMYVYIYASRAVGFRGTTVMRACRGSNAEPVTDCCRRTSGRWYVVRESARQHSFVLIEHFQGRLFWKCLSDNAGK